MKKLVIACVIIVYSTFLYAQDTTIESRIRFLEQEEVKAVLEKDSAKLLTLWDKDYVVNNPENQVVFPGKNTLDRPVLKRGRISFTREVEYVIVKGDVVFSMGNETVIPVNENNVPGQKIYRRFTNIWMKSDGIWKLEARHANIICQKL